MFDPNKRQGAEEKKPGIAIAVSFGKPKGFNPSKRLGEESSADEAPAKSGDPDQLMDQACEGICDAINVSSKAAPRLREYLEAFFHAADSKPHDEGEHTNEENEEG
jgi:hypothetical protein